MTAPVRFELKWLLTSETYLYPETWAEPQQASLAWRAVLELCCDDVPPEQLKINGLEVRLDVGTGLIVWTKVNQVDRLASDGKKIDIMLHRLAEPEDDCVALQYEHRGVVHTCQISAPPCPSSVTEPNATSATIHWQEGVPHLLAAGDAKVFWHYQLDGVWESQEISSNVDAPCPIAIPVADTVMLEVSTAFSLRRFYVVGRPGVPSGRHLWYRGNLYAPKLSRQLPWLSVIAPVFHLDDIERVPASVRWDQIDWWLHPGEWQDDAVTLITEKFPGSRITRIGNMHMPGADLILLRPYELHPYNLAPGKRYAVVLFEDAIESGFGRRGGWMLERLSEAEMANFRFVERAWQHASLAQTNPGGLKQYGLGFAFARPPEHESMWGAAQKNMEWREQYEYFTCYGCAAKNACRQLLPMPYAVPETRTTPWISVSGSDCPVRAKFG